MRYADSAVKPKGLTAEERAVNTRESTRPERLEKSVEIGTLCAFYGGLLTQRQQEMLRLYYEEDFSLGEIAEQFGVSRQNVHELITRSVQKLRRYEAALGGAGRMAATVRQLTRALMLLEEARGGDLPTETRNRLDEAAALVRQVIDRQEGEERSHGL